MKDLTYDEKLLLLEDLLVHQLIDALFLLAGAKVDKIQEGFNSGRFEGYTKAYYDLGQKLVEELNKYEIRRVK